jgi:hypothetical protein
MQPQEDALQVWLLYDDPQTKCGGDRLRIATCPPIPRYAILIEQHQLLAVPRMP